VSLIQKMHKFAFSGISDVGLKRTNNEDTFVIRPERHFCLAADGMGGAAAGEVASLIFAETASEVFAGSGGRSKIQTLELVQRTFGFANERILDHVKENPHHMGMGCTAELLAFYDEGYVLGHMGDSRTYILRNGVLKQLTHDHSLVQEQIDKGIISPAEARNHPLRHIILRAVGIREKPAVDLRKGRIYPGDIFLLCSDGLTDMVDDPPIQEVLSSSVALPQKVKRFIELAKSEGGKDNITVVLSEII